MTDTRATIDRSRRHHSAETARQTVHLPGQTLGHHGGGGSAAIWAEVIVELQNADAEASPPTVGVSEYVMRLAGDATADYSGAADYIVGNTAIGSDGRKYTSRTGTVESPNTGNDPVVDPPETTTHWTLEAEINPRAMGWESISDMRKFLQRYLVGTIVELTLRESTYLIAGMVYIDSNGSLATGDDGRAMAVYAD